MLKGEFLDLDKYLESTLNVDEIRTWNTEIGILVGYDEAKNISAEEMYLICKGLNDSGILGYEPLIYVSVDKIEYVKDEVIEGRDFFGTTFPNKRYNGVEDSEEKFISRYNFYLERSANR